MQRGNGRVSAEVKLSATIKASEVVHSEVFITSGVQKFKYACFFNHISLKKL